MTKSHATQDTYGPPHEAWLRRLFDERTPFNRLLGLRVHSLEQGCARLTFEMRPDLVGNMTQAILHGGVISAVLDTTGGIATLLAMLRKHPGKFDLSNPDHLPRFGTVDLRVDYLRPGRGQTFVSTGRVLRLGNKIAVAQLDLENEAGELIANGSAVYLVG